MAEPYNDPVVPEDMWLCGECRSGNLLALSSEFCPACGHERDSCCTGPGNTYPQGTGFFQCHPRFHLSLPHAADEHRHGDALPHRDCVTGHQHTVAPSNTIPTQPDDVWYCSECGAANLDHLEVCPVCNKGVKGATVLGAGTPAPGAWVCQNCGSANSDLTPDFCGACGVHR